MKCSGHMKVNARGFYMCYMWKPLLTDQWDSVEVRGGEKLADLSVCASACALVMRRLRNPRFCDDDRTACIPIAMASRDRSFDVTTASFDFSHSPLHKSGRGLMEARPQIAAEHRQCSAMQLMRRGTCPTPMQASFELPSHP